MKKEVRQGDGVETKGREQDQASKRNKRVKDCSRQVMQSPGAMHLTKLGLFLLIILFLLPLSLSTSATSFSSPSYPHLHIFLV